MIVNRLEKSELFIHGRHHGRLFLARVLTSGQTLRDRNRRKSGLIPETSQVAESERKILKQNVLRLSISLLQPEGIQAEFVHLVLVIAINMSAEMQRLRARVNGPFQTAQHWHNLTDFRREDHEKVEERYQ